MKLTSLTSQKPLRRITCVVVASCFGLMNAACSADVTLMVDFTGIDNGAGPSGGAAATAPDFAANDSAIDPDAIVNIFNADTEIPGASMAGVSFVADFSIVGTDSGTTPGTITSSVAISTVNGSFNASPSGPFGSISVPPSGDPILTDYIYANSDNNFTATIDTSAIVAGSTVKLVVYSHGDRDDQVADLILNVNGTITTSPVTSMAQPFQTFTFTQPSGVSSLDLTIDNAGEGSAFAVLNGFSITSIEPAVLKGDVNLDDVVNFGDIPPFITVLQSGNFQPEADLNCNEVVDFDDIPLFIVTLQGGIF